VPKLKGIGRICEMKATSVLNKLARHRTILANERTFLAYIRTSIMLAVSGVTLIKFFESELHFYILGISLLPAAFAIVGFGFIRYRAMCKRITKTTNQETGTESENEDCTL
jgi:putative membrane protein